MDTTTLPPWLPSFLAEWEPMEIEDLPLQVALLTMEMAAQSRRLRTLETALGALAASLVADDE